MPRVAAAGPTGAERSPRLLGDLLLDCRVDWDLPLPLRVGALGSVQNGGEMEASIAAQL
jgi:hypothetical protein